MERIPYGYRQGWLSMPTEGAWILRGQGFVTLFELNTDSANHSSHWRAFRAERQSRDTNVSYHPSTCPHSCSGLVLGEISAPGRLLDRSLLPAEWKPFERISTQAALRWQSDQWLLQHETEDRKEAVAEFCSQMHADRKAMASRTKKARMTFLKGMRRSRERAASRDEERPGRRPRSLGRGSRLV